MPTAMRKIVALLAIVVLSCSLLWAQASSKFKPEDVGFSTERLQRIHETVQREVDNGTIPGAVTFVSRKGHTVFFEAQGFMDPVAKKPMQKDSIYWIASMSKPVTAVAILMLMEEGKLRLSDPASRFIPELKVMNVVRVAKPSVASPSSETGAGPVNGQTAAAISYDLVPAQHEITIRDLITHTSGLVTIGVKNDAVPDIAPTDTLASWIPKLASVPLDFQPGTKWAYSNAVGFDVLSRIVEVASAEPFDQFLKERIFEPLGMKDTGFGTTGPRVGPLLRRTPNGFLLAPAATDPRSVGKGFFSGAAGMYSTAEDYGRFAEMLMNGGERNGKRLLSPNTIELMSANHVGDMFPGMGNIPMRGIGFGLGVIVVRDAVAADLRVPLGSFGWDGIGTFRFWVSPKEKLVIVMIIPQNGGAVHRDIENAVMQSLVQ